MRSMMRAAARRFCRDERGTATIDFAIIVTMFATILGASVEMGYLNIRHAMLERGLDTTVRELRLATGFVPGHDAIRQSICDRAGIITDCAENLRLEMKVVDPRSFEAIPGSADCRNADQEARPLRNFQAGAANELMLLRACLMFKPVFPTSGLAAELSKDNEGYAALVATSAFVQEPR
ncbi:pilus assembly protein [Marinovum sp. 2_MG-2023]|uniref:TadE/TadG family type IV pilus assembly protein n=1 Tax=Roseobacteraceae TaxID=2854170 RepID=UPI001FD0F107|nr:MULTISPECIES: pilus assembly protein [Roseobacteraceae]MCJ7874680.1 pilus assembly protein [Phaeobacter sp. J2-8]MDO6728849.1 pilus assembly protein [Marinovum sp. 2_MG-2023]MDO6777735.1 pilus assembly protein [Marinovum sp. 1_MG-2023]